MKNCNNYVSAEVVCPFYQSEFSKKIKCEGFGANIYIHIYFSGNGQKDKHKYKYCHDIDNCNTCPVYQMAYQKYREDEDYED